jgi:hypothetical protein
MPFAHLAEGERAGWRPSLVLTPMVVETGDPLFISNLELSAVTAGESSRRPIRQFFHEHPTSTGLSLATAVRMNASFPFVSPAVALPEPSGKPERIVDAGYFDNFGVSSAVAILSSPDVRRWIAQNTSGVLVIQIRASVPLSAPLPRVVQFLTSPAEAMSAARNASMLIRNDLELAGLRAQLGAVPVHTVVLSLAEEGSMSWYLTVHDVERIRAGLTTTANRDGFSTLAELCPGSCRRE